MRWFYRYEVEHLLARAGFREVAVYGDFAKQPFRGDSPEIIAVAREAPRVVSVGQDRARAPRPPNETASQPADFRRNPCRIVSSSTSTASGCDPIQPKTLDVINPATEQPIATHQPRQRRRRGPRREGRPRGLRDLLADHEGGAARAALRHRAHLPHPLRRDRARRSRARWARRSGSRRRRRRRPGSAT